MKELWRKDILELSDDAWLTANPYSLIFATAEDMDWFDLLMDTKKEYHPGLLTIHKNVRMWQARNGEKV